jgi:hypothetical protein
LYTRAGRLLAHSGTVLTEPMAAALEAAEHTAAVEMRFDTRAEPIGVRPGADFDQAPPTEMDDSFDRAGNGAVIGTVLANGKLSVEQLDVRNWERRLVRVRADLRRAASALVQVARVRWEKVPRSVTVGHDPVIVDRAGHGPGVVPSEIERGLRARRARGVAAVRAAMTRLLDGEHIGLELLTEVADDLIDAISRHPTLFAIPAVGLPRPVDSLPDHAFTTGALAIGIAAQLGWPRAEVRAVGIAGFLCDAGVGLVPHPVRQAGRPLTEIEINAIRRHTEYAVALLRNIRAVPESVVLSVYQHHERCDGSGYPTGIKAEQMHDFARVLGVAEAFAGMTAPRAHRPALTPHAAMSELAHLAAAGAFDASAVRALLDVLGLYPAGSFVKLSSGHVAVVGASARPGEADRPTVHVVQPEGSANPYGRAIDLAMIEPKQLRVVEAVRAPEGIV